MWTFERTNSKKCGHENFSHYVEKTLKDLKIFGKQCAGSTQLCESCSKTYLLSPPEGVTWGRVHVSEKNPEITRVPLPYDFYLIMIGALISVPLVFLLSRGKEARADGIAAE